MKRARLFIMPLMALVFTLPLVTNGIQYAFMTKVDYDSLSVLHSDWFAVPRVSVAGDSVAVKAPSGDWDAEALLQLSENAGVELMTLEQARELIAGDNWQSQAAPDEAQPDTSEVPE